MKIETFKDACKKLKRKDVLPDFSMLPEKHQKAFLALFQLVTIIEAINGKWSANWNDSSQTKYYPWFRIEASEEKPSGFSVSCTGYDYTYSATLVGSRLVLKTSADAMYVAKQFEDLYKDWLLIL